MRNKKSIRYKKLSYTITNPPKVASTTVWWSRSSSVKMLVYNGSGSSPALLFAVGRFLLFLEIFTYLYTVTLPVLGVFPLREMPDPNPGYLGIR